MERPPGMTPEDERRWKAIAIGVARVVITALHLMVMCALVFAWDSVQSLGLHSLMFASAAFVGYMAMKSATYTPNG